MSDWWPGVILTELVDAQAHEGLEVAARLWDLDVRGEFVVLYTTSKRLLVYNRCAFRWGS